MELFSVYQLRANRRPQGVSCVWVPTGNARQPLVCVWIDAETKSVAGNSREAVAGGESHLGLLAA
ncbi:MAG TPA: hypothetical protein VM554_04185 [Acidisarcina sp.]|nr:hypothetical protein [Acidisarcina sp.]